MAYEPFLGEICEFGFEFAPVGWADCNGQMMQISQNNALFALLGTTYGGDGIHTFALPDLRPFQYDVSRVVNTQVQVTELQNPLDPTKHNYAGQLLHTEVVQDTSMPRVDWREKGLPRKCIALQGIFPSRP